MTNRKNGSGAISFIFLFVFFNEELLFIDLVLAHRVTIAAHRLSLVAVSGLNVVLSLVVECGLSRCS